MVQGSCGCGYVNKEMHPTVMRIMHIMCCVFVVRMDANVRMHGMVQGMQARDEKGCDVGCKDGM